MKQYVIDEIRLADHTKVKAHLDTHHGVPGFEGLYHITLALELLTPLQKEHVDCGPYYFALELLPEQLSCELLVRTNQRIRCDCIQYATIEQRDWLIEVIDAMFLGLGIIT